MNIEKLKEIAEKRAATHGTTSIHCLHNVLLAMQDALKDVDGLDYAAPNLMKATNALTVMGNCGVYLAGPIALSIKYGTEDYTAGLEVLATGWKGTAYGDWFKEQFGSANCYYLSGGSDFSTMEGLMAYLSDEEKVEKCRSYCVIASRKLIELLTESE